MCCPILRFLHGWQRIRSTRLSMGYNFELHQLTTDHSSIVDRLRTFASSIDLSHTSSFDQQGSLDRHTPTEMENSASMPSNAISVSLLKTGATAKRGCLPSSADILLLSEQSEQTDLSVDQF